jgi:beta-glucanase (GH16 family)
MMSVAQFKIMSAVYLVFGGLATVQAQLWSEEFDAGSVPDSRVWSYDLGDSGWGNSELQSYTSSTNNVRLEDGKLIITALREGHSFTSARVKTQDKFTFKYGTVEARIKTPDLANGLWPAFWMLGHNYSSVGWPACGEIDVLEMGSASAISDGVINRRVASTAHWENEGSYASYGATKDLLADLTDTFIVYRMEWTPSSITTYFNGVVIWTMSTADIPAFNEPHFLILNMAVGGAYTGLFRANGVTAAFPAEYAVDYIRIYDNGYTELGGTSQEEPLSVGTNLLENADFESSLTGWSESLSGGAASTSPAYVREGSASLVIDSSGAGDWASPNLSQRFSAGAGNIFNFQGYMLNPAQSPVSGGSFGVFKIEFRDRNGTALEPASVEVGGSASAPYYGAESTPFLSAASATDTWIFSEVQAEAPADTAEVGFFILNVNQPGASGPIYFDHVSATLRGDAVLPFSLSSSFPAGDRIQIRFPTQEGMLYQVAYKGCLTNAVWIPLETVVGDGRTNSVSCAATHSIGFYRVYVP